MTSLTLHPDVVKDLLPVYLAGDASPATRELVEAALAADAALARLARLANAPDAFPSAEPALPPTAEKRALDATRRRLRWRSWLMGGALFASLLPLTSKGDSEGVQFFLLRDAPVVAGASLAVAAALWAAYLAVGRRLRVTGL
jgi:hypothetical protein